MYGDFTAEDLIMCSLVKNYRVWRVDNYKILRKLHIMFNDEVMKENASGKFLIKTIKARYAL